jgi:hypothetical protein
MLTSTADDDIAADDSDGSVGQSSSAAGEERSSKGFFEISPFETSADSFSAEQTDPFENPWSTQSLDGTCGEACSSQAVGPLNRFGRKAAESGKIDRPLAGLGKPDREDSGTGERTSRVFRSTLSRYSRTASGGTLASSAQRKRRGLFEIELDKNTQQTGFSGSRK